MSVAKQVREIRIGLFYYNGSFRPWEGGSSLFQVWNINARYEQDFQGQPVTRAIGGFERGGMGGHRARITIALDNSLPASSAQIKTLLDAFSSQYERTAYVVRPAGTVTNTTVNIANTDVVANGFFVGTVLKNIDASAPLVRVTAYNGVTGIATVSPNTNGWSNNVNVDVTLQSNIPTVFGISTDDDPNNIIYCNLVSSVYGIQRELTIGSQIISMDFTGVNREQIIPDGVRIG